MHFQTVATHATIRVKDLVAPAISTTDVSADLGCNPTVVARLSQWTR
jgi:hypothetical protein